MHRCAARCKSVRIRSRRGASRARSTGLRGSADRCDRRQSTAPYYTRSARADRALSSWETFCRSTRRSLPTSWNATPRPMQVTQSRRKSETAAQKFFNMRLEPEIEPRLHRGAKFPCQKNTATRCARSAARVVAGDELAKADIAVRRKAPSLARARYSLLKSLCSARVPPESTPSESRGSRGAQGANMKPSTADQRPSPMLLFSRFQGCVFPVSAASMRCDRRTLADRLVQYIRMICLRPRARSALPMLRSASQSAQLRHERAGSDMRNPVGGCLDVAVVSACTSWIGQNYPPASGRSKEGGGKLAWVAGAILLADVPQPLDCGRGYTPQRAHGHSCRRDKCSSTTMSSAVGARVSCASASEACKAPMEENETGYTPAVRTRAVAFQRRRFGLE